MADNSSTASRVKLADVEVDRRRASATTTSALTGPDAGDFEVDSNGLYLKAGTSLDAATKSSYTVSVTVDDTDRRRRPPTRPAPLHADRQPPAPAAPATASVAITEVSPWSSGDSSYGGDWFELTNTGTTSGRPDRLADERRHRRLRQRGGAGRRRQPGARATRRSSSRADATTAEAFEAVWFGGSAAGRLPDRPLQRLRRRAQQRRRRGQRLRPDGDHVAGVAFGASTSGQTFDNTAALGSGGGAPATISTLSADGVNGAFTVERRDRLAGHRRRWRPRWSSPRSRPGAAAPSYAADWFELTNNSADAGRPERLEDGRRLRRIRQRRRRWKASAASPRASRRSSSRATGDRTRQAFESLLVRLQRPRRLPDRHTTAAPASGSAAAATGSTSSTPKATASPASPSAPRPTTSPSTTPPGWAASPRR